MKDLAIIGAGPAGLSAAIYGKRAGLDVLVIDESGLGGGQVLTTYEVDNYPGLPQISGFDLGDKLKEHANKAGAEFMEAAVTGIIKEEDTFILATSEGTVEAKTVIVATGAKHKHLMIPGEEELLGMGVSYCATCDGAFFRNRTVAVVGGGDVALEDALFLARGSKKVYLIHRRNAFRGAAVLQDKVNATENIEVIFDSAVTAICGEDQVEKIILKSTVSDEAKETEVAVDGIFIAVGMEPVTEVISGLADMDDNGYVVAGEDCITSMPGLFVAGDLRTKKLRQIVTATADGANAVTSVNEYLNSVK